MIVYYRDGVAFDEYYEPSDDERTVLLAIAQALPDTLPRVRINPFCEYVRVAEGVDDERGPWAEYHFDLTLIRPIKEERMSK